MVRDFGGYSHRLDLRDRRGLLVVIKVLIASTPATG
jgi:hypothetical protein